MITINKDNIEHYKLKLSDLKQEVEEIERAIRMYSWQETRKKQEACLHNTMRYDHTDHKGTWYKCKDCGYEEWK